VTFSSDQLDRIARLHGGDLAEISFAAMLYALARARRTTCVQIQRGPLHKQIFLEDGIPVDCRSNLVSETLSRFMVTIGRLDETTADDAFRASVAQSVRFGDVLVERGLVSAEELMKILQQNLAHKLLDGFSWRDGSFRTSAEISESDSPLKVNVAQLILIGVGRFATQDQIDGSIGPLIGTELAAHPAPPLPVADRKLSAAHRSLVEALRQRPMRIDQLAPACGLSYEELTRHLYALTLIELVVPADRVPKQPAPKPADRKADTPVATPPAPRLATRPAVPDTLRKELMEVVLNHRRKDPFELLGVDPDRAGTTAHQCFLRFAEKYAPWKFDADLAEQARDLFLAGARAYAHLCDPERRAALVAQRARPAAPPSGAAAPDTFRVTTELLDPQQQFRAGMKLAGAGHYLRAIEQLEFAVDLDPQNLRYRAELAFCRFRDNPEANAITALTGLAEVTRIDPQHGLALYYTGEILRHAGRLDEAEVFLKRALKPMAPDRRPVDALRALTQERKASAST